MPGHSLAQMGNTERHPGPWKTLNLKRINKPGLTANGKSSLLPASNSQAAATAMYGNAAMISQHRNERERVHHSPASKRQTCHSSHHLMRAFSAVPHLLGGFLDMSIGPTRRE